MTAIITCTQNDFQYIDEWINYHRSVGVDLFLIAYNGDSISYDKLPKYGFVRYFDLSYNTNYEMYNDLDCIGHVPFHFPSPSINVRKMSFQIKALNMLFTHLKHFYSSIKYSICMDIDEFIVIKNGMTNINDFLDSKFNDDIESMYMHMQFYGDNGLIYNDGRPVLERFLHDNNKLTYEKTDLWHCKSIVNLHYKDQDITDRTVMLTSHCTNYGYYKFNDTQIDINEIELAHFWTKSLEEFIAKFNKTYNSEYLNRFKGKLLRTYFFSDTDNPTNALTIEKLMAIDELLDKYNIDYSIERDEKDTNIKNIYLKYKYQKMENKIAILVYLNSNFELIENFVKHYSDLGVTTFYFAIDTKMPLSLYDDPELDIHYVNVYLDEYTIVDDENYEFGNIFDRLPHNVKSLNLLYEIVRTLNTSIDFVLPLSIYDMITLTQHSDLNRFVNERYPKENSSFFINILYIDTNNIDESNIQLIQKEHSISNVRALIYIRHIDVNKELCKLLSAHHCGLSDLKYTFNIDDIYIVYNNVETLESYISLFAPDSDSEYKQMYENNILGNYFSHNQVTYEKLQDIRELLEKYNIDYRPELQEINPHIRVVYKEANKLY